MRPLSDRSSSLNRRDVLRASAGFALGSAWGWDGLAGVVDQNDSSPLRPSSQPKSVVGITQSSEVQGGGRIRMNVLKEMLEAVMRALARKKTISEAWLSFLKADDVIGLHVDTYGKKELETIGPFVRVLVQSLLSAGWKPEQIVLSDGLDDLVQEFHTKPYSLAWTDGLVDFGSGKDQLCTFVREVTAIVNIPVLKNDNLAGLSGCLKNLSYGMVRHPAQFKENGYAPYLADITLLPEIHDKLRLNVVNGLRVVYDGGPLVDSFKLDQAGLLVAGTDPLAVDRISLDLLNVIREKNTLPAIELQSILSLLDASQKGLGTIDLRRIERRTVTEADY